MVSGAQKITSANSAATAIMSSEPPACTITGRPCGVRGTLSGPRTENSSPLWVRGGGVVGGKKYPPPFSPAKGIFGPPAPPPATPLREPRGPGGRPPCSPEEAAPEILCPAH